MAKYGIDNVRGGTYCTVDLDYHTFAMLTKELRGASDACLRCGRTGHFANQCYAKHDVSGNPIPNDEEEEEQVVSSCYSSDEEEEEYDACYRCGRIGHWEDDCYARTDIYGYRL